MIRLVKNPLHPEAVYVDLQALTPKDDLSTIQVPEGLKRVRITLDADAPPPEGWDQVKRMVEIRVPATLRDVHSPLVRTVNGPHWEPWFEAHWDYYRDTHDDNPPERPDDLRHTFGDAIEPGTAVFIGDGFASLRGMKGGVIEAGWIGGSRTSVEMAVNWCIDRAAAMGAKFVAFEAEDTDPPLWNAIHAQGRPYKMWITYEITE